MNCPKLSIRLYTTVTPRRARRGHRAIPARTKVFLIKAKERSFAFCYLRKEDAETAMQNLRKGWNIITDENTITNELEYNFYTDPERCLHIEKLYFR